MLKLFLQQKNYFTINYTALNVVLSSAVVNLTNEIQDFFNFNKIR